MLLLPLTAHPLTPAPAVRRLSAGVRGAGDKDLEFRFILEGDLSKFTIPTLSGRKRSDGLWRKTCFEAFLKRDGREEYVEFNFSPSGEWAAYEFSSYREGMRNVELAAPIIALSRESYQLTLDVSVKFIQASMTAEAESLNIALSAVVEADDGGFSYWALAHPSAKPDFHHPQSFTHALKVDAQK